jgi:hypothetical protein
MPLELKLQKKTVFVNDKFLTEVCSKSVENCAYSELLRLSALFSRTNPKMRHLTCVMRQRARLPMLKFCFRAGKMGSLHVSECP